MFWIIMIAVLSGCCYALWEMHNAPDYPDEYDSDFEEDADEGFDRGYYRQRKGMFDNFR